MKNATQRGIALVRDWIHITLQFVIVPPSL